MIELTKKQALDILMLLSALESWSFVLKERPDYWLEDLDKTVNLISEKIIN